MKIETTQSLTTNDMMELVEPIMVKDITVEWRDDDHISLSYGTLNISARVDLDQSVSDKCAELFGTNYQGMGHGGFLGFYVDTKEQSCHTYVSISEEVSMRGVRKDRQAAKEQQAIEKLKARATQFEKNRAVDAFLSAANEELQQMIKSRNEDTMRYSMQRVQGSDLCEWADKSDDTIAEVQAKITELHDKISDLKGIVKDKRTNLLKNFIEEHGEEYNQRVMDEVREAITKRAVFNESSFRI